MAHKISLKALRNQRGMTLVELMIVVAIIGILASIAGVAFLRQVSNAKTTQLEQYAMDIARGQNEFISHHGSYFPVDNATVPTFSGADAPNTGVRLLMRQIMSFEKNDMPPDVIIRISAGDAGEPCNPLVCVAGIEVDTTAAWYAVSVERDLDPGEPNNTTIVVTSSMEKPVRFFEGQ